LATNKEKTNRHLRLAELLQEHSIAAELIVMYANLFFLSPIVEYYCNVSIFTFFNPNYFLQSHQDIANA